MCLNFMANSFRFGRKKRENAPRNVLQSLHGENFQMRLSFIANRFVFRRINREISPTSFFINLASGEVPKCV